MVFSRKPIGCHGLAGVWPSRTVVLMLVWSAHVMLQPLGVLLDRDAVQGTAVDRPITTAAPAASPDALPSRPDNLAARILFHAEQQRLDAALLHAVIQVESNFKPDSVSRAGAMGLMQLMPVTARGLGVVNPFDIEQNLSAGARYLRHLLDRFNGDLVLALAAYNAGPRHVRSYGGLPPFPETHGFVRRVLTLYGNGPAYTDEGPSATGLAPNAASQPAIMMMPETSKKT